VVDIRQRIAAIDAIAKRRGGSMKADVREPADPADIAACEENIALELPPSLKAFLAKHDGMSIRVHSGSASEFLDEFSIEVRSAADIAAHTLEFRDFQAQLDDPPRDVPFAMHYINAVDLGNPDLWWLLDAADKSAAMEYPLYEVSTMSWPVDPGNVVAASFSEFIDRALEFMITTEGGFAYWAEPSTDW
jgi:hypothetical protein